MVMELQRRRLREPSAYLKEKYGVTITELAVLSGLDRTTLNSIWVGRRKPMYATARAIATALGIEMGELDRALQRFQDSCPVVIV